MTKPQVTRTEPRIESGNELLLAGLRQHFTTETQREIPALWQRFAPYLGRIPGQLGRTAYGVCFAAQNGFDYLSSVEVSSSQGLPDGLTCASIPAQQYVVFTHDDHVSKLPATIDLAFHKWLPESDYGPAGTSVGAALLFERYGEGFDPRTGTGDIEVWIPIQHKSNQ